MKRSSDGSYARMFRRHAHPVSASVEAPEHTTAVGAPVDSALVVVRADRRLVCDQPGDDPAGSRPVVVCHSGHSGRGVLEPGPDVRAGVLALAGLASGSLAGAMVAAYQHRRAGAVVGSAVFIALTLCEWRLWADRFTRDARRPAA